MVTSSNINNIEPVVAQLVSEGKDAIGIVCDVSIKDHRKNLIS